MKALLQKFLVGRLIARFVGQVPDAIRKHLNVQELLRIGVMTFLATGSVYEVLPALLQNVGLLVPAGDVALATAALTFILETVRRLNHGTDPVKPTLNLP